MRQVRRHERDRRAHDDHAQRREATRPRQADRPHRGRQGRATWRSSTAIRSTAIARVRNDAGRGRGLLPAAATSCKPSRSRRLRRVAPRDGTIKLPDRVPTGRSPFAARRFTRSAARRLPNGTVVIEQGRIRAVGQNGSATIPPNATVIDGRRAAPLPRHDRRRHGARPDRSRTRPARRRTSARAATSSRTCGPASPSIRIRN